MAKDRDESAADEKTPAETSTDEKAEEKDAAAASADDDSAKKDEAAASADDGDEDDDDEDVEGSADDDDEGDDEDVEGSADDDDEAEDSADDDGDDEDDDVEDSADEDVEDDEDDEKGRRDEKVAAKGRRGEKVAAKGAAREEPAQERTRLMILGAVLVGLIVVAVIAYTDGSGGEEEPAEGEITDATEEGATPPEKAPPNPFEQLAQQQGPEPIPAPEDVGQPPQDAERSESGLAWKVLEEGTGTEHPSESDLVTIHYTGWTGDGRMVDSSVARDEPAEIPLSRAVPGWKEGVPLMVVGEKRRFWVPPELADTGRGPPPGPITFDVELLAFEPAPEPPDPPRHLSGPPPNAQRTDSGLAYRVLQQGSGTENPSAQSRVRAHFTGWSSDGEMLDTSVVTGEPALLPSLQRVLPGMREGIEMMVVGEKRRLWIPEELAFNGRPGAPEGMLVFDIELVEILEPPPNHPGMPGMPGGHPPTGGGAPPNHPPMPRGGGGGPPG